MLGHDDFHWFVKVFFFLLAPPLFSISALSSIHLSPSLLYFFCMPLYHDIFFNLSLLALPLLFTLSASTGVIRRGSHPPEILFHYPRCIAVGTERGHSSYRALPGLAQRNHKA
jgi:hypothetical protein